MPAYHLHTFINITNLMLFIGVVLLVSYRYYLTKISLMDAINNSNAENTDSFIDIANFDDLIQKSRLQYLHKYHKIAFFDYASHPLYPNSVIDNFSKDLHSNLYGNTHSESESADLSTNTIDFVRNKILDFFGTNLSQYTVLFTYSHYQSLKLLVESFPFTSESTFLLTANSHHDILRLQDFASKKKSKIQKVDINEITNSNSAFFKFPEITKNLNIDNQSEFENLALTAKNMNSNAVYLEHLNVTMNLLIVPLVDEFEGTVLHEHDIKSLSPPPNIQGQTAIVVDASLYNQNHKLDLSSTPVHAVTMSFERMFGFPHLGALIVHNSFLPYLNKPYFGGGTLVYALTSASYEKLRLSPQERFEDGSLPFLSIVSIQNGFSFFNDTLGFDRINHHVKTMKNCLYDRLMEMRYLNGSPLIQIYSSKENSVSIVTFNILDETAKVIPYQKVIDVAADADIYLTGGCFTNPESCFTFMKINEKSNLNHAGAIRASVGWATTKDDIDKLINHIEQTYLK